MVDPAGAVKIGHDYVSRVADGDSRLCGPSPQQKQPAQPLMSSVLKISSIRSTRLSLLGECMRIKRIP